MDWIKKNYDQFALVVLALLLLVSAIFAALAALEFPQSFGNLQTTPPAQGGKLPPIEKGPVDEALVKVKAPVTWAYNPELSLFVAHAHLIDATTKKPRRPGGENAMHPPVPDKWLMKHNLNLLAPNVLQEDPDKDGYSNLDEYLGLHRTAEGAGSDSTDPTDPNSHPPSYSKLYLKQYIKVPFRFRFDAYDGDRAKPSSLMTFQINTLDLKQSTEFLEAGQMVRNTKFKIEKFTYKAQMNPNTGVENDVSELSLLNTETQEHVTLILGKVVDSPDSYALFSYKFPQPAQDIKVKKLQEFVLPPKIQEKYKLIDIKEREALIALPSGEKYSIYPQAK